MAKLGVSAIRINCQDLRPEVYGVEKMEIVTDHSESLSYPVEKRRLKSGQY